MPARKRAPAVHLCHTSIMTDGVRTTISDWLREATMALDSRLEAELLLGHALGQGRGWLYGHGEDLLAHDQRDRAEALLARRRDGEPVAYLLGEREFWSRPFRVTPDVLVPRPETELIVEQALALDLPDNARVLDLGTGSGCIAVTLACERPGWAVVAVDISDAALAVARTNAQALGASRIRLHQGSWYEPLADQRFDLIVSNPPYVAEGDPHLSRGDVRFEPVSALTAGPAGLRDLERIISGGPNHLRPSAWLMVEMGFEQAPDVAERMRRAGLIGIHVVSDLAGLSRLCMGQLPGN